MNLNFKNAKDEKPDHGEIIVVVNVREFYDSWSLEQCEVEYSWDDGNGNQICYDPDDRKIPEGYTLHVNMGIDYMPFDDETTSLFWAYQDDISKTFEENGL